MGPATVSLGLALVLGLTSALQAPTVVTVADNKVPDEQVSDGTNRCPPSNTRRQDLLDSRLNALDTRLSTQLNGLDARLTTELSAVHTRLNRIDTRFDGIDSAIATMEGYIRERMAATEKKVEWSLNNRLQADVTTTSPRPTTPRPPIVMIYTLDDYGEAYADGELIDDTIRYPTVKTVNLNGNTRLLAFKVSNNQSAVGPRAWLSTGLITSAGLGWICSPVFEEGWNQLGFDDSQWRSVEVQYTGDTSVVGRAVTVGCGKREDMGKGPYYFRKTLIED